MTTLEHFVSPALTRALGWTLLHSLWQGALVAAVLAGALLLLRRQRAEVRYGASAAALSLVVALAGITFGLYLNAGPAQPERLNSASAALAALPRPAPAPAAGRPLATASNREVAAANPNAAVAAMAKAPEAIAEPFQALAALRPALLKALTYFDRQLPLLVVAWLLGLLAMSLRMVGGLLYVQRLRRYRVRPLSAAWQARLAALAARSGVRRPVALLESALVQVPLVVGHLRPVILLPLGAVAGLSPAYLEAILAHELAHVLRRDYLVNLLQTVAETVFFYHPAVWFVAGCVRTERENCCDDTATALCGGDALRLARALTALAEWSQSAVVPAAPRLALAAIGHRGALLSRVRRLVQRRPAAPTLAEGMMAGALVLGGLGLLGSSMALARPLAPAARPATAAFDWKTGPVPTTSRPAGVADTAKKAKGITTSPTTNANTSPNGTPQMAGEERREIIVNQEAMAGDEGDDRQGRRSPRRRAVLNGRDVLPPPGGQGPGTVVITQDNKRRLTNLVVNGQPVETATARPSKADRRAGRQVTVVAVPAGAPGRGYPGLEGDADDAKAARKLNKAADKLDKAAEKINKAGGPYVTVRPGPDPGRRTGRRTGGFHIDIDEEALSRLANSAVALGSAGLNIGLQAAAQGIEEARRELEAELRDPSLDAEGRRAIRRALDGLRREQERPAAPERPESRERADELRRRRQELQERIRESEQELRDLERDRAESDADRARDRAEQNRSSNEALLAALLKDGLIRDQDDVQVKLTARTLVVQGKEQPPRVFEKYRKLYETSTGRKLSATGSVLISRNSSTATDLSDAPRPPRPPRPLDALPAQPAPSPPRPPRPLPMNTELLKAELRKDGVMGAGDKDLQLQLNNAGLTVNGQKQPEALAAKYRKLLGHDDGQKFNVNISSQE